MIRLFRLSLVRLEGRHVRPIAALAGLAMAVSLSACGDGAKTANQAAAQADLKAAGQDLTAAANATGAAVDSAAQDAKPALHKLDVHAKQDFAQLSDAAGVAVDKAGHALDKAGQKADVAAHRAADKARETSNTTDQ